MSKEISTSNWRLDNANNWRELTKVLQTTSWEDWSVFAFSSLSSTMDAASLFSEAEHRSEFEKSFPPLTRSEENTAWTLFVSDAQTSGRGREGRTWVSGGGKGIYVTYVVPPVGSAGALSGLSLVVALAVTQVLLSHGLSVRHKWPNDIFAEQEGSWRKISGILVDTVSAENTLQAIHLGLGIDWEPQGLPEAVSFRELSNVNISRSMLLAEVSNQLRDSVERFFRLGFSDFVDEWAEHSLTLNRLVEIDSPGGKVSGEVLGVNSDGALRVRCNKGEVLSIYSGSLRIPGIS